MISAGLGRFALWAGDSARRDVRSPEDEFPRLALRFERSKAVA